MVFGPCSKKECFLGLMLKTIFVVAWRSKYITGNKECGIINSIFRCGEYVENRLFWKEEWSSVHAQKTNVFWGQCLKQTFYFFCFTLKIYQQFYWEQRMRYYSSTAIRLLGTKNEVFIKCIFRCGEYVENRLKKEEEWSLVHTQKRTVFLWLMLKTNFRCCWSFTLKIYQHFYWEQRMQYYSSTALFIKSILLTCMLSHWVKRSLLNHANRSEQLWIMPSKISSVGSRGQSAQKVQRCFEFVWEKESENVTAESQEKCFSQVKMSLMILANQCV